MSRLISLLSFLFFLSFLPAQIGSISPIFGVSFYLHDVMLGILLIVTIVAVVARKKFYPGQIGKSLALFIGVAGLSLLVNIPNFSSSDLLVAFLYLLRLLCYASVYWIVIQRFVPSERWMVGLYAAIVGFAVLGGIQYVLYPSLRNLLYQGWDEHQYRLFSTLLDPNFAGMLMVIGFLVGFSFLRDARKRHLILLSQCILLGALLLTYSRSSFAALIVAGSVYALRRRIILPVFLLALFGGVILVFPTRGSDSLKLTRAASAIARFESWGQDISLVAPSPIIGRGFNTLRAINHQVRGTDEGDFFSRDAGGLNSSLLVVLVTTGIIGVVVFCYFLWTAVHVFTAAPEPWASIGLSTLSAILTHSFFNNTFFYPWVLLSLMLLLGSVELLSKKKPIIFGT